MSSAPPIAVLFPGQGSQEVGMGADLLGEFPAAAAIYERATAELGAEFQQHCFAGPATALNDTATAQPALYVHSVALWEAIRAARPNFKPHYGAGHSLGEFSALTAAGALEFGAGLRLVRARGEAMRQAGARQPGGMAALIGLEVSEVTALLEKVRAETKTNGHIVIANDNCPAQIVISGDGPMLQRACAAAKTAGARRILPLNVSVATHSPLMENAAETFAAALAKTPIEDAQFPIIANTSARAIRTQEEIRAELRAQLTSSVRWRETSLWLLAAGVEAFYEIGAKNVLSGLLRRTDRSARATSIRDGATLREFLAQ